MTNMDERSIDKDIGPEGDTVKVAPEREREAGAHPEPDREPAKRHGDALETGTGTRHGLINDPDEPLLER